MGLRHQEVRQFKAYIKSREKNHNFVILTHLIENYEFAQKNVKMQKRKTSASGKIQYLEAHVFGNAKLLLVFRIHNF